MVPHAMLTRAQRKRSHEPLLTGIENRQPRDMGNVLGSRRKRAKRRAVSAGKPAVPTAGADVPTRRPLQSIPNSSTPADAAAAATATATATTASAAAATAAVKPRPAYDERNLSGQAEVVCVDHLQPPSTEKLRTDPELGAFGSAAQVDAALERACAAVPRHDAWEAQHDAIITLRRVVVFHPLALAPRCHDVLPAVSDASRSLRSSTQMNAVLFLGELFAAEAESSETETETSADRDQLLAAVRDSGCVPQVVSALLYRSASAEKRWIASEARVTLQRSASVRTSVSSVGADVSAPGGAGAARGTIVHQVLQQLVLSATADRAHSSGAAAQCATLIEYCLAELGVGKEKGAGFDAVPLAPLLVALCHLLGGGSRSSGRVTGDARTAAKKALRRIRAAMGATPFEAAVDGALSSDGVACAALKKEALPKSKPQGARGAGSSLKMFAMQKRKEMQMQAAPNAKPGDDEASTAKQAPTEGNLV